jgi:hypothetical protein
MSSQLLYRGPTLQELHEQYAKRGRIDERAPVRAARSVDIDAAPDRVWQVLSSVADWPTVGPAISHVRLPAGVAVDAAFTWTNDGARIRSRFAVVEHCRELTWTGVSFGARAVHRNLLHRIDAGTTRLVSQESMAGPLLSLIYSSTKLGQGLTTWLSALKTAAEQQ